MTATLKSVLVVIVGILIVGGSEAQAQNEPLKGRWVFTLDTPVGRLPLPARFKVSGEGEFSIPNDVPLVYRENGALFSISAEVSGEDSPTGQPFTLILRGAKSTDDAAIGTLLIVTETPDPSRPAADPIKVVVAPGTFTAIRQ